MESLENSPSLYLLFFFNIRVSYCLLFQSPILLNLAYFRYWQKKINLSKKNVVCFINTLLANTWLDAQDRLEFASKSDFFLQLHVIFTSPEND